MREPLQRRAERLFQEIVDQEPGRRAEELERQCGGDAELRAEVQSLLTHFESVQDDFLQNPPRLVQTGPLPDRIGPYHIERILGQGGMGRVYLAEQPEPLPRKVALKVMAFGSKQETTVARFLAERRILARMTHPYIAQVYDAGTTEGGHPYFVMEYVPGEPLPAYCDRRRLTVRERIELFLKVCSGIQHAHQKGVIHRDLKPSNVLVAMHEGVAVPKIIDFGVAKDFEPEDPMTLTSDGSLIGTPEYMSPEQAGLGGEVDTRSDVYGLGMLLYTLLIGSLPFDSHELAQLPLAARLRRVADTDSPRPSARIDSLADSGSMAAARCTDPMALRRQLRGDLDWITLRAIEKEADRRYASVHELAADLSRFLRHEPVTARPPDIGYTLRKLVRRHPRATAVGVASIVFVLSLTTILAFQNRRIAAERARSREEAETAGRVVDFVVDMFKQSDPRVTAGESGTAREILRTGMDRLDELDEEPAVQARLLRVLGIVHASQGFLAESESLLTRSLVRLESVDDEAQVASSLDALATTLRMRGAYERAESLQVRALDIRGRVLGAGDTATLVAAANLALLYQEQGRYEEAQRIYQDLVPRWRQADGGFPAESLGLLANLGTLMYQMGHLARADSVLEEVVEQSGRLLGEEHVDTLNAMNNLATVRAHAGEFDEAIEILESTLAIQRRTLGEHHPATLRSMANLASTYADVGRVATADSLMSYALVRVRDAQGIRSPDGMEILGLLADLRARGGRIEDAGHLLEELVELQTEILGPEHPKTLSALNGLAAVYRKLGRTEESEELLVGVLGVQRRSLGPKHPDTLRATSSLGLVYERMGRWRDAEVQHRSAYEGRRDVLGAGHRRTLRSLGNLIRVLVRLDREDEALELARQGVANGLDLQRLLADPAFASLQSPELWKNLRDRS